MSRAAVVFEQYSSGRLNHLRTLLNRQIETEVQDFKLASRGMDDSARKSFAEGLSGFVNAEGGVIIWGGNCRKNSSGEDVLQELIPVPNILKFTSELQELTPQLVAPAIVGVRNEFFEDEHGSGAGYAITYVPKVEGLPHMAMGKIRVATCFAAARPF
jgi:hypothetical protein